MLRRLSRLLALSAVPLLIGCSTESEPSGPAVCKRVVDNWTVGEIIDTEGCGVLARVNAENTPWGGPFYVLRVEGTHYEMGYQHGRLLGPRLLEIWWTYMESMAAEAGMGSAYVLDGLVGGMMDSVWNEWYGPNTPQMFHEELQGFADGMKAAKIEYGSSDESLIKLPRRVITLIDLAMSSQLNFDELGALDQFMETGYTEALLAYYSGLEAKTNAHTSAIDPELRGFAKSVGLSGTPLLQCSYFAAWGDRTDDGGLYMTRNMDFSADTGIWTNAAMAVYVPDDGVPYASISWLGATLGVLAGINREGIAVGAVGSESPFERLNTEPALLRAREALERSANLADATPYFMNGIDDGLIRAPTIGFNALVSWGDPRNDGADAQAVVIESNGLETGIFHHRNDCSVDASLVRYDLAGEPTVWTAAQNPDMVNSEADAKEIDANGNVRFFEVDGAGDYVKDENGAYVEVATGGQPMQTGYPTDCALYRGDEAMAYGVRVHQAAANGPARDDSGLMTESGSWQRRYWPMYQMTKAYEDGTAMMWEGEELIADNGGEQVKIGLDQTELVSRTAAMSSNVWDVVFDCTDLVIRVTYESGTGDDWVRAGDQPGFYEVDLRKVFLTE